MIETLVVKKRRASNIYALLKSTHTNARSPLNYYQPHELLIANILLEDCTYNQVNAVTKNLYKKYQSIIDFAYCNLKSLEVDIDRIEHWRSLGAQVSPRVATLMKESKAG